MTCIIALAQDGSVYMGGDSAGVDVQTLAVHVRTDAKVFITGEFIFGFTTSFRMGQLLQYSFTPPEHPPEKCTMAYMVTDFIDAIREVFSAKGFLTKLNEGEVGGDFLVGYRGKIYEIANDFQVGTMAVNYASLGCGADFAQGVMFATSDMVSPESRITLALDAAEYFSGGVTRPYKILKLPPLETTHRK